MLVKHRYSFLALIISISRFPCFFYLRWPPSKPQQVIKHLKYIKIFQFLIQIHARLQILNFCIVMLVKFWYFQSLDVFKEKLKKTKFEQCPCNVCRVYIDGIGYIDNSHIDTVFLLILHIEPFVRVQLLYLWFVIYIVNYFISTQVSKLNFYCNLLNPNKDTHNTTLLTPVT